MKYILVLCAFMVWSFKTSSEVNYRKVFGEDYLWAVNWLKQNNKIFTVYSEKYKIPSRELKAIIFPELIRYNKFFDGIQIESLKYLYVTEGEYYADFSVGFFQMKPSFADKLEREADSIFGYAKLDENENNRRNRLVRLTKIETQINYLCAFYRLCEKKFQVSKSGSVSDKIRLFATAYNAGYHLSENRLRLLQLRKQFSGYNYSDISLYAFNDKSVL